jgi:hypothetical protein
MDEETKALLLKVLDQQVETNTRLARIEDWMERHELAHETARLARAATKPAVAEGEQGDGRNSTPPPEEP